MMTMMTSGEEDRLQAFEDRFATSLQGIGHAEMITACEAQRQERLLYRSVLDW